MSVRALLRVPGRLASTLLLAAAFTVPIYVFVRAEAVPLPSQVRPPTVAADSIPKIAVSPYRNAVPVLVYHDISERPGRFTVSPLKFATQMAALHALGFHTVSASQMLAFLKGAGPLPLRPVLITFDDGLGSEWRVADPILARYGFRAMAFVISGQLGHHGFYYLHPSELRAMIRSGRWDVEAHTHLAHLYAATDASGDYSPALLNRIWLPRAHRVETEAEYRSRIARDLTLNIAELRGYGAQPHFFAYPFSASRTPTNDVRLVAVLHSLVRQRFKASFVDADGGRFLTRYDGADMQELPRIEVTRGDSATSLVERLGRLTPMLPRVLGFRRRQSWQYEGARPRTPANPVRGSRLVLRTPARAWLGAYLDPARTNLWAAYRVSAIIKGLGTETSGASETVIVGAGDDRRDRYGVTLSAGRASLVRLRPGKRAVELRRAVLAVAPDHRVRVVLGTGSLGVIIDGREIAKLRVSRSTHGGIGFGTWRAMKTSPDPSVSGLVILPLTQHA